MKFKNFTGYQPSSLILQLQPTTPTVAKISPFFCLSVPSILKKTRVLKILTWIIQWKILREIHSLSWHFSFKKKSPGLVTLLLVKPLRLRDGKNAFCLRLCWSKVNMSPGTYWLLKGFSIYLVSISQSFFLNKALEDRQNLPWFQTNKKKLSF